MYFTMTERVDKQRHTNLKCSSSLSARHFIKCIITDTQLFNVRQIWINLSYVGLNCNCRHLKIPKLQCTKKKILNLFKFFFFCFSRNLCTIICIYFFVVLLFIVIIIFFLSYDNFILFNTLFDSYQHQSTTIAQVFSSN